MISQDLIILFTMGYLAILFYIAYRQDQYPVDAYSRYQPLIYTLSITIYCTSWTYFGAVGNASTSGWDYFSIYLGPIMVFLFMTPFLRKLITVSKRQKTTTIADFIATRYGKSHRVAAIATLIALIGTLPYIALQIKAIASAYEQLAGPSGNVAGFSWFPDTAFVISIILAIFTILFGARTIDASEHHRGMMHAIALESVVKLIAFLIVAALAITIIFDISLNSPSAPDPISIMLSPFSDWELTTGFITRVVLAAAAIVVLPRQFHVMAVEGKGNEINIARWGFSIYLLIFSIAVIPIVAAGIQTMEGPENADLFVLSLPMIEGSTVIAMITYIGGFSAATGMVIVAAIALSTMVSNDLIFPLILRYKKTIPGQDFSKVLLLIRRATILILLLLAYGYYQLATSNTPLYSIGLLSFAAAVQFMPAIIGGLYWKTGHRDGTFWGLTAGFMVWLYTLLLPSLSSAQFLPANFMQSGFFGFTWLNPRALFGITFDDYLTHGVFWSLLFNISLYVFISLRAQPSFTDKLQANAYVEHTDKQIVQRREPKSGFRIQDLFELCSRFTGEEHTRQFFLHHGYDIDHMASRIADESSISLAERLLASSIGSATAGHLIRTAASSAKTEDELFQLLDTTGEALKFNREILQVAIDNINQGVSVVDHHLCLTAWNRTYVDLFEYPEHLLQVGKPIEQVIRFNAERGLGNLAELNESQLEDEISKRMDFLRHGEPYSFVRYWPDGRVIQTRGARMPDGGFITTFTDITDLKQAEKELEATNLNLERKVEERTEMLSMVNIELQQAKQKAEDATRSKTHFLAAASHDLTQPLGASKLYLSALIEDLISEGADEKHNLAKNALSALTTAESLLKSLLDISKLDSGSMNPDITRFPLQQIFTAIDNEFSVLAAEKGLQLHVVHTKLGTRSDISLLRSVLQNFVSNAVRYTREGIVLVGCRRRGDSIRIEVHDTGIGIPEDKSATIFQEFQQLNANNEGAGLGLAICQRMAHLLNHKIEMHSIPGRGSCFSITVPRCKAEAVEAETQDIQTYRKQWLKGIEILCVDDDREILRATHTLLERWGGHITCLQDANQFDEITMEQDAFDVVLMDYRLNDDHKGLDLLKSYRQRNDNFLGIVVTAEQDRQIERDTLASGFKYLAKPVEPAKLRAIMQAAFMDRKLAAEAGP
ncbi:MAG TPA: PAS domain-containing hybrid sensor histidine kinase/response regulator [Gammaproteobacteria bacterium]